MEVDLPAFFFGRERSNCLPFSPVLMGNSVNVIVAGSKISPLTWTAAEVKMVTPAEHKKRMSHVNGIQCWFGVHSRGADCFPRHRAH